MGEHKKPTVYVLRSPLDALNIEHLKVKMEIFVFLFIFVYVLSMTTNHL